MSQFLRFTLLSFISISLILSPAGFTCEYDPLVAEILSAGDQDHWVGWIAALSSAAPIPSDSGDTIIRTRSSYVMFELDQTPSAFTYLQEELTALGFTEGEDFTIHTYAYPYGDRYPERNWKNLILTFSGEDPRLRNERILMVAHLDSTSGQKMILAPGADDNASGCTAEALPF